MKHDMSFCQVGDADIARALSQIPPYGWPSDEDELVALFGRVLEALAGSYEPEEYDRLNIFAECG